MPKYFQPYPMQFLSHFSADVNRLYLFIKFIVRFIDHPSGSKGYIGQFTTEVQGCGISGSPETSVSCETQNIWRAEVFPARPKCIILKFPYTQLQNQQ